MICLIFSSVLDGACVACGNRPFLPPTPLIGCAFLGGGGGGVRGILPPILRVGSSKNYVSEKVGTVGKLYQGKMMKKMG